MKLMAVWILGSMAVAGTMVAVGCRGKSETEATNPSGMAAQTGAAVSQAVQRTVDVATNVAERTSETAKAAAEATKDAAGQAVEKTGASLEKAGTAVEKAGAEMQK